MELFLSDRKSIQHILEPLSLPPFEPGFYEEKAEMQWIFEICKVAQLAANEMAIPDLIDTFLVSLGFREYDHMALSSSFHEISQSEAKAIFTYLLSYDLVHHGRTNFNNKQITAVVERLFELFSVHPHYFTNGEFNLDVEPSDMNFGLRSWNPITIHTFDAGLIIIDEIRTGISWDAAED